MMTENDFELALMELFQTLGYESRHGGEMERPLQEVILRDELLQALERLNPDLPREAIAEAFRLVTSLEHGSLIEKNARFTAYLQGGVQLKYFVQGSEERSALVRLLDYDAPDKNSFIAVNQLLIDGGRERKRPDVILYINGLPLVVIELKSPTKEEANAEAAFRQIRNYMQAIPTLFEYNAFCVISDLTVNKAGTISAPFDRFMEWKSKDGAVENSALLQFDTFYEGLFCRERLLDILRNFILFQDAQPERIKVLAAYHQYFAVRKAVVKAQEAVQTDGKGGVFWHTQGSGKSLSMVFYAHLLRQVLEQPTLVVMTDRIDLDDQLYQCFARCESFLYQRVEQAQGKEHLRALLKRRQANGIIFTTMFKFEEGEEALSDRRDIIIISDEAHRGQYGLVDRLKHRTNEEGEQEAYLQKGFARLVRQALPHATFVGFTGTPVSLSGRNTQEVFGDYIDVYDMTQAVADGATRPVYYESRVVKMKLKEEVIAAIDAYYESVKPNATPEAIACSQRMMGTMEKVLGASETLDSLCEDMLRHYEANRAELVTGKALVVAYSRRIAIDMYRKILALRPEWTDKIAVVMTGTNNDPEDWKPIVGDKRYRQELAERFRDNESPLKMVIVVDMWLTGFDLPSLATMYVYKPMKGHNLMQAIARVNRVFGDKEGGLIVDYVGIAAALKAAMKEYTKRDNERYGDPDIAKTAYPTFQNKRQVCRDILFHFGMQRFEVTSPLQLARVMSEAVNYLLELENVQKLDSFMEEAQLMKRALSLCASLASEEELRDAAYFDSIRSMINIIKQRGAGTQFSLSEMNEAVAKLLTEAIESEGVLNVFESQKRRNFSLFDAKVLAEIAAMKHKNIALELIKRLIDEQVRVYKRTNQVRSEEFSERLKALMNQYYNGHITNEEVIDALLKAAQDIANAKKAGQELGLNEEEQAFYDALTKPEAVKEFYSNEQLKQLTCELADLLRASRTLDWQHKASARADMRVKVKRLLKKYKYPPDEQEKALATVISQCELWADHTPLPPSNYTTASKEEPQLQAAEDEEI